MRHRAWVIVAAIPVLLLVADVIYWRITSTRLQDGLKTWIAEQRAQGWQVDVGAFSRGGWPETAAVSIANLTLRHSGQDVPGNVSWTTAALTASVALYRPAELDVRFTGPQHIRVGGVADAIVTGEQIRLSIDVRQQDKLPLTLRAKSLRLEPADGRWHATVGLLNAEAEVSPAAAEPAVTFSVSSEAIALPTDVKWPLGENLSSLSFDGGLNGQLPQVRNITAWAEAWRNAGGSLDISRFAMGWGPLGLTGAVTLALDDQLQPMGRGSGRVVGYAETLDRLAASGVLTRSAAMTAKAVLSLLAGPASDDRPSGVDVPLTLQYRTLSMRQVPLLRLPELDWPDR